MGTIRFIDVLPEDKRPEPKFKAGDAVSVDTPYNGDARRKTPGTVSSAFHSLDGRRCLYIVQTAAGKFGCREEDLEPVPKLQEQGGSANG